MTLQIAIQIATLVSVFVGIFSLIYAVKNYHRQMNAQILMKYAERYEDILTQFPPDAVAARFDITALPPETPNLTLCVLRYFNLCSEEFYLVRHGYLSKSLWQIWEGDLKRIIGSSLLQREWKSLRSEFESHQDFLEYVESIQSEQKRSKGAHA